MDANRLPDLLPLLVLSILALVAVWWSTRPLDSPLLDASPCVDHHWEQWEDTRGTVPPQEVEDQWWEDCMATHRTR